jgi:hypothetical protein
MAIQDVHQLNVVGSVANEFVECIMHFQQSGSESATPAADSLALCNGFQATFETAFLAMVPDDFELAGYKAKRVNNTGGPSAVLVRGGQIGTVGADSFTSAVGPCIIANYYKEHAAKPRWATGRIFVPGAAEGLLQENLWQAPVPANCAAFAALLMNSFAALAWTYGVYHKATVAPKPITEEFFYAPTLIQLSAKPGVQRRRLLPTL